MNEITKQTYLPPVDQLLTYEAEGVYLELQNWPDYLALGLGPEHIPDLIRLATDMYFFTAYKRNPNSHEAVKEYYVPFRAWRALAQLRSEEAIDPLIAHLKSLSSGDYEDALYEISEVLGFIGPAALPALTSYLENVPLQEQEEYACMSVIEAVEQVAERWPEAREDCIAILSKKLALFAKNNPEFNAFLILSLIHLKAMDTIPLIQQAYAANSVYLFILGTWDDAQILLGLKTREEVYPNSNGELVGFPFTMPQRPVSFVDSLKEHDGRSLPDKKSKQKMAKKSRKKNRKR